MKDMQKMMKQAQKMAAEMQKAQASLSEIEVEGSAGGGAVTVRATADMHVTSVDIAPSLFDGPPDEDDLEMLGDAVLAAVNAALDSARDAQEATLGPIAGGLGGAGGLGLPGGM